MPVDFADLARSVSALPGVQACLLLSGDGLVLGAAPPAEEGRVMATWARLSGLGQVERGFVTMAGHTCTFARRGPLVAVAVSDPVAQAGVVLAQLDHVLLTAEEARVRSREEMRTPQPRPVTDPAQAPRFRAPLHRDRDRDRDREAPASGTAASPEARPEQPAATSRLPDRDGDDWEIDVVELSREFGGLWGEQGPAEPGS
jgi:hypothetical protein